MKILIAFILLLALSGCRDRKKEVRECAEARTEFDMLYDTVIPYELYFMRNMANCEEMVD